MPDLIITVSDEVAAQLAVIAGGQRVETMIAAQLARQCKASEIQPFAEAKAEETKQVTEQKQAEVEARDAELDTKYGTSAVSAEEAVKP